MSTFDSIVFTNPTEHTLDLAAVGLGSVSPGQDVPVPLYLCAPRRTDNGGRGKSPIEQVAPQLKPKDKADAELLAITPPEPKPVSKIVSVTARAPGEAPGVAAIRAAAAKKASAQ